MVDGASSAGEEEILKKIKGAGDWLEPSLSFLSGGGGRTVHT